MNTVYRDLLAASPLFASLDPQVLDLALQDGLLRSMEAGEYYFWQGDRATHAYVLLEGRVKMQQVTANGLQIVLRIMSPGDTFGGVAYLDPPDGYPASALAAEDSLAMAWSRKTLLRMAAVDTRLAQNIMHLMYGTISELQIRQQSLVASRVEQRIARVLLKLAAQCGVQTADGVLINLPISRQDVAEMSGTTLYTASRIMREWARQGWLDLGRERVLLRRPHQLVQIADDLLRD
jgi:CRP-like cAMP-binding protein